MTLTTSIRAGLALSAVLGLATAHAEQGAHPAVLAHARAVGIDANHFIVQPPASVTWVRPHANGEHPAVLVARQAARQGGVDGNTFIVQPPATVAWRVEPETDAGIRLAVGRGAAGTSAVAQ